MEIFWWYWLVLGGLLLIFEMLTGTFAFLIFSLSSLIPMFLSLLGCNIVWQIIGFAFSAFIIFLIFKSNPNIWASKSHEKFGSDQILETEGVVTDCENLKVRVNGEIWSAVSQNGENLNIGDKVIVKEVKGVRLIVKREDM